MLIRISVSLSIPNREVHQSAVLTERRKRMFALQFGNQSIFMIHDCTHKSSDILFPTCFFFFFFFHFGMWCTLNSEIYFRFHLPLVCSTFRSTSSTLMMIFVLTLPGIPQDNIWWQTRW